MSNPPTRRHVLIAENNRDVSRTMSALLNLAGYDVETVYDGRQAVDAACAHSPAIVILDIGLPRLDGYHVAEWLRGEASLKGILIIAISGYDADMHPALATGPVRPPPGQTCRHRRPPAQGQRTYR